MFTYDALVESERERKSFEDTSVIPTEITSTPPSFHNSVVGVVLFSKRRRPYLRGKPERDCDCIGGAVGAGGLEIEIYLLSSPLRSSCFMAVLQQNQLCFPLTFQI